MKSKLNSNFSRTTLLCIAALMTLFSLSCTMSLIYANTITARNRESLNRLSIGMSKAEALEIMGRETTTVIEGMIINSPYRVETVKDNYGNNLEIMFFYTDEKREATSISDDELTPVVLKEGKVEGWGRTFLSEIAPSYRYREYHHKD